MRWSGTIVAVAAAAALPALLRADPGDTDGSHDYPGFIRPHGFIITDYTEDNPAAFDFTVSRPLPIDWGHLDAVHVTGHRYVIRYAPASGNPPLNLIETQRYYERLAANVGFVVVKTGATGDVNETFLLRKPGRAVWACLEPGPTAFVLTVMETIQTPPGTLVSAPPSPAAGPAPVPTEDPLYLVLMRDGHVVLPVSFLAGKTEVDADSGPVIGRVVAMMNKHADLLLTVEGHTDGRGDPDYNKTLSLERARSVRDLIVAGGVAKTRLTVTGLGGGNPIADDSTTQGRLQNRRIELVVRKS